MRTLFEEKAAHALRRGPLEILQVNVGNLCNQECRHCHIGASPGGDKIMGAETVDEILAFLEKNPGLTLDITGGAPELNPNFRRLVSDGRPHVTTLMARSNLTVLLEPGMEDLIDFLAKNRAKIIASLPCYTNANVEAQRGEGVFEKSIAALRMLNRAGYGIHSELLLDLVYNPAGPFLPGERSELEAAYRARLKADYGVAFNSLITMINAPIGRFAQALESEDRINQYIRMLVDNFNPGTLPHIMCRHTVSVGHRGFLYDCDFNQALDMVLCDERGAPLHISRIRAGDLEGRKIVSDEHCFSCTAGVGSGCGGALIEPLG